MFGRPRPIRLEILDGDQAEACALLHATAFPHPWSATDFERLIGGETAFGEAALPLRGKDLVGFILSRRAADEAEILTVAVDSAWRGQGVARRLLDANMKTLARHGVKSLFLEVGETNTPALRLYAGSGFVEVGRRNGYYRTASGKPATALTLRRKLD